MTAENLASRQETLSIGKQMVITKMMNLDNNREGVYGIKITDLKDDDDVNAVIIDPSGNALVTKSITTSPIQEFFKVPSPGNYTLQIDNHGQREIQILGFIGYYPVGFESDETSGNIVPIMLIIGLSGLAVGTMYLIKNRAKPQS